MVCAEMVARNWTEMRNPSKVGVNKVFTQPLDISKRSDRIRIYMGA